MAIVARAARTVIRGLVRRARASLRCMTVAFRGCPVPTASGPRALCVADGLNARGVDHFSLSASVAGCGRCAKQPSKKRPVVEPCASRSPATLRLCPWPVCWLFCWRPVPPGSPSRHCLPRSFTLSSLSMLCWQSQSEPPLEDRQRLREGPNYCDRLVSSLSPTYLPSQSLSGAEAQRTSKTRSFAVFVPSQLAGAHNFHTVMPFPFRSSMRGWSLG